MNSVLKSTAIKIASLAGRYPARLTDRKSVDSLMQNLFPVSVGKELIRLGPKGDGGYLVPDDLMGLEACFSPGVSDISGFERDCAELGMQVFMADASVTGPVGTNARFDFKKKFVGAVTDQEFVTLDDWVRSSLAESSGDLILQMDIEGYEYETLLAASEELMRRFRILVIEFHNLDQLWNDPFFLLCSRVFNKILKTHACVHIHPNNVVPVQKVSGLFIPPIAEFTFIRKDRFSKWEYATAFPHELDMDNTKKKHLPLPDCWYKSGW